MASIAKAGLLAGLALLAACDDKSSQSSAQKAPVPAVVVAKAAMKDTRPTDQFTGRVQAVDEVDLRARVQGFLEKRLFSEGQQVEQGQLLFVIDPKPFAVDVDQREAERARAEANMSNAKYQLDRGRELLKSGNIPKSEVDKREAGFLMAQAQVKEADAALEGAKIRLGYTEIRAPIAGRIGRSTFTEGTLVGPQSPPMASIVRGDEVYVAFPVSQRTLMEFRKQATEQGRSREVAVRLIMPDGSTYAHPGKVDFLDIRAEPGTDTVSVRAVFPNPDGMLVPGQFANVVVETKQAVASVVVPQAALQVDQSGPFVLVVDSAGKVEIRHLRTRRSTGDMVVVEQGLQAGDAVIVEGAQKVRPGQEVQVSEVPPGPGPGPGSAPQ